MGIFTRAEMAFLAEEGHLARVATVGPDGMPHVTPSGFRYNADKDTIDLGGHELVRTKKYRDIQHSGVAAVVIDDVLPPWRPRGIEIRARAETVDQPTPLLRLHPLRVVSWGLESDEIGERYARDVT
jgi:pyridoxamine 5'-phosphate oxidase family protein